jgi:hypothetical protein
MDARRHPPRAHPRPRPGPARYSPGTGVAGAAGCESGSPRNEYPQGKLMTAARSRWGPAMPPERQICAQTMAD